MTKSRDTDLNPAVLGSLLKAELGAGLFGLRLFIACVAVTTFMMGGVWMLGGSLSDALQRNGLRMLGGDVAVSVPNTPLDDAVVRRLAEFGTLSRIVELRSSAVAGGVRAPVEIKTVDDAYPLYGAVGMKEDIPLDRALATANGERGALVEPAFLSRFGVAVGDSLTLGNTSFRIRGTLLVEPDRLSAGSFLVGPRVIIHESHLAAIGVRREGALAEYRYRLRFPDDADRAEATDRVERLEPERGWEIQTPRDAGDRVRRTVERTTTFLGVAGVVALAIGLAGAWGAAASWVTRRGRTIALYRLSGASPPLIIALHAALIASATVIGLGAGLAFAFGLSVFLIDMVAARLHLPWQAGHLVVPALQVAATVILGVAGASVAALSAAARTPPGSAMRSAEVPVEPQAIHVALGAAAIALAMIMAVMSLPVPGLAAIAALGLAAAAAGLGLGGLILARLAARQTPRGFISLVALQGLSLPASAAVKALAIGIGIAGITGIVAAQNSLELALRSELPEKIPDLVLIGIQPDAVEAIRERIERDPALGSLQATPNMRATILAVNGIPVERALVNRGKAWVIEGDRSFSWTGDPTGAELLAGEWWPPDYDGEPLISAEEDVMQAFDLKPGDRLTYSVLGRTFTSEVVNIRKEYHRTFRPEFLLVASPDPFRNAPHSWVMSMIGESDRAVDKLVQEIGERHPGVTAIDVRQIVAQVREVIDGAVLGSLAIALTLLAAGALSLAAVVAADVDAREREALAYTLIGAGRKEIALARVTETLAIGLLAAVLGGTAGLAGGLWVVDEALRIDWAPGIVSYLLPLALGAVAALAAGAAGGMNAVPRGRGQMARRLAG